MSGVLFSITPYISPESAYIFQLLTPFGIPFYLLFILLLVIVLWLRMWKTVIVVSLYLLINIVDTFTFLPIDRSNETDDLPGLSVLSYNVSFFKSTQFNPLHKVNSIEKSKSHAIQQTILDLNADVICLQEYYQDDNVNIYQLDKKLGSSYDHYFLTRPSYEKGRSGGISIFSRYPIIEQGIVLVDSTNRFNGVAFVDIRFNNDTIRIINAHLHSMQIRTDKVFSVPGLVRTFQSLKRGSIFRHKQIEVLTEFIRNSPHKVILAGDLNELSNSYNYHQIARLLNDAFMEAGNGLGYTLNKTRWSLYRIDYQFYSDGLVSERFEIPRDNRISDHFPTYAVYRVK
tara:strand:+ start:29175 stop:30203 length:1029 start_codon:yes stop_codon:yes gene_type:complete